MRKLLLLWIIGFLCAQSTWAQAPHDKKPLTNLRKRWIPSSADTLLLDTFSMVPGSLVVAAIADSFYEVDYVNARFFWKIKPSIDSVWIQYRVFNARINAVTQRMRFDSIVNNFIGTPYVFDDGSNGKGSDGFFDFGTVNYTGSLGRGITFGNTQDPVVNSTLNMQLSGFLADSIEIAAAITDNNIPIQPDGNTQQLNEFDRVFLQFKKRSWQINLGDIDIRQNKNYFLNFYKRLQGAAFETNAQLGKNSTNTSLISGSIAKGKFTRNVFQGQEGNQGPYRLQGANNEFFFIVLPNTERVFIDGELLQRGEDQDYVINYNTAEITFTPRRMITKDKRMQVEFEYSDRNYLNVNLYFSNETRFGDKLNLRVGLFNNSDSKSSPINQTLDPKQKQFLRDVVGDSISKAFYPVYNQDTFAVGKILYKRVDSVYNGGTSRDSVFIYSTSADSARYNLTFIDVGESNGDYVPEFNGANGKVYRWVQPVMGKKRGRYAPVALLITPKKQQLFTIGADYNITKNFVMMADVAMSDYDVNTFSNKEKGNDKGYAGKIFIKNTNTLGGKNKLKLIADGGYEYIDSRFKVLERLRNVEFTRDWGLDLVMAQPATEKIITGGVQLEDDKRNSIRYQLTTYNRGTEFSGFRNTLLHQQTTKGWRFNNQFNISQINSNLLKGTVLRPSVDLSKTFAKWYNYTIGGTYTVEENKVIKKQSDSLTTNSFSFETLQLYVRSSESKLNKWSITYFTRNDKYPVSKELIKADRSQNVNFNAELAKSEKHQFRWNVSYRNLQILRNGVTNLKSDESLLGRMQYSIKEWKGLIQGEVLYEVGAGQEQRRDFAFLEVPPGRGEYTWNDYNNDGIQQLNEFEIALFKDQAKYIRIFTPTNDFIKAAYNTFNYSINLNPRAVINTLQAKGVKQLISRFNLQSSLQIFKKEIAAGFVQLDPFKTPLADTSLISLSANFINVLSFNRFSTKWGIDMNYSRNTGKAILTYGLESRRYEEWGSRLRWSLSRSFQFDCWGRRGENQLVTGNFDNRNFFIQQYSLEPQLSYIRKTQFRFVTSYKYANKKNKEGELELYTSNSLVNELKYNVLQNVSVQAKFTYTDISFGTSKTGGNFNANSTVGYIMLDGLQPGKNYLWNVDLTKRLSNSLEMNIQYSGRKPGTGNIVHIGQASLKAIF